MTDSIKFLDPVKGLIEYVEDIKPYHTKIIESLVEYVSQEFVETSIIENYLLHIGLDYGYSVPLNQTIIAPAGITIVNTNIPTRSNLVFVESPVGSPVGSPPLLVRLYNFDETLVFVNGILQKESIPAGMPDAGVKDYSITGPNQITFVLPLELNDIVTIYTYTQHRHVPTECDIGGFGSSNYDMRNVISVVSPDPMKYMTEYPGLSGFNAPFNTFIVMGNRTDLFDPTKNVLFLMRSFVESYTGSPISLVVTEIPANTRDLIITNSELVLASGNIFEHTIVTVADPSFNNFSDGFPIGYPPTFPEFERYVITISLGVLNYNAIIPYSNIVPEYDLIGSPIQTTQTPDEGIIYSPIIDLGIGASGYFTIYGDFRSSNLIVGDLLSVVESTGNNDEYVITGITHILEGSSGSPIIPAKTKFDVANVINSTIDGNVVLNIQANSFVLDGNYAYFFPQGMDVNVTTGSAQGIYTTLKAIFINNKTYIRVIEDILQSHGSEIISVSGNTVTITGDFTPLYTGSPPTQFNLVRSQLNNGTYNVTGSSYTAPVTTITVAETFNTADTTGTIFYFAAGILDFVTQGFGQTSQFCADLPDNIVNVGIDDNMHLDTLNSSGSPPVDEPMYQFVILGTTTNTITVSGDATVYGNLTSTNIIHSNFSPSNDGQYDINAPVTYDINNNTSLISVIQPIGNVSGTIIPGGWIEGNI